MPSYLTSTPTYVLQDRGDRASPHRSHPRYVVLKELYGVLKRMLGHEVFDAGGMVVDYGCGNRPYEHLFRTKFTNYIGADLLGNPLADIVINPDMTLPLSDNNIDSVLSSQVLEHVEDPQQYLCEAFRILKPGGNLILSTHGTWRFHPDPTDYWRWTIDGLQLEIERAGFEIVNVQSVLGLASTAIQLWQDATASRLIRPLRSIYITSLQQIISLMERKQRISPSRNASVYVVLARKVV